MGTDDEDASSGDADAAGADSDAADAAAVDLREYGYCWLRVGEIHP